ncbi:MAG: CBS domain-containing protein [candidate division WOR-3 bacterium]|nr:MAG: CBS domain-containing protein [candidate division WOR-3 bacterium]
MKIEDLPVSELMNRNVLTVLPSTTLKDLISLMRKTHQHIFPVLADDATLLGVVNYNDILNIFRPFSRSVSEIVKRMPFVDSIDDEDLNLELSPEMGMLILVDDIINKNYISVKETSTIKEARRLMRIHKLQMLPVVSDKKFIGVISTLDILVYVFKEHDIITK